MGASRTRGGTPFGLTGPRRYWRSDSSVASAAGGMTWLGGDPDGPPIAPPRDQASQLAGSHAAIAALLATLARERTGTGQFAEISLQEAVAASLETGAISWIHAGIVPKRNSGVYSHVAHRIFPSSDGYLAGGYSGSARMWDDLLAWMVEEGEAGGLNDAKWQDPVYRWRHREHVDTTIASFTRRRNSDDVAAEARRRALPWAAVATPKDLLENPQLAARKYLIPIRTKSGDIYDVGYPYDSACDSWDGTLSEPLTVDDNAQWKAFPRPAPIPRQIPGRPEDGALSGLRVLDLTWVLAGPYVTKLLGEHGADIIKVESKHRHDPTRFSESMRLRPNSGPDDSGYFINFNRNKRGITLNLRNDDGVAILQKLAAQSDIIVENFSPGTLAKWKLDWDHLKQINSNAILVSMSGLGATGPWRNAVTFADTLAAMSGLTSETGSDSDTPEGLSFGLGDIVAANAATIAILDYLVKGRSGHIDLSQLEAMAAHLGSAVVDTQLPEQPNGLVGPFIVKAKGSDRWLAVCETKPATLRKALTQLGIHRQANDTDTSASLHSDLSDLSASDTADSAAARLQENGIGAYPVRDGRDLTDFDEQLSARNFFTSLKHPIAGSTRVDGLIAHLESTPGALRSAAPLLGQHTFEVLSDLLDLSHDEIEGLQEQGALE